MDWLRVGERWRRTGEEMEKMSDCILPFFPVGRVWVREMSKVKVKVRQRVGKR